jgi:N-acetylglucosamine-6-sulfatase
MHIGVRHISFARILLIASLGGILVAEAASARPSIVLILTDDQRTGTISRLTMPTVKRALVKRGVTFRNAFVTNPLCCPSRTTILTGQFSHRTRVYSNRGPYGGFGAFRDESTVATWLDARGYRTALIGKYLNGYTGGYVPPGWDRWIAFKDPPRFFDYTLVSGRRGLERHGSRASDYSTDVLGNKAARFIRRTKGPLFLYFAPFAPHYDRHLYTSPAPRHANSLRGRLAPWRPPGYAEPDVSDKPSWIRRAPLMDRWRRKKGDRYRRTQLESLMAVDDAVAKIVRALRDTERLRRTMIVFTSDNGIHWGEHRWFRKVVPYEPSLRVPLVVRYDRLIQRPRISSRFVLNVDLAPTFARTARTAAPKAEGRSLLPLLAGRPVRWRRSILLEGRDFLPDKPPAYCGIRTAQYKYIQYRGGLEELYNLRKDPYELANRAGWRSMRSRITSFRQRLRQVCRARPPALHLLSPRVDAGVDEVARLGFAGSSRFGDRHDAGQLLALEKLERRASPGGDPVDAVGDPKLAYGAHRVAAADD